MAIATLLLQLLGVLAFSLTIYNRFTLGIDFSIYNQAVFQIFHGDLHGYSTILQYPILKSHFELILWPLAGVMWLSHSTFTLLAVQDLSLVGTGIVVVLWVAKLLERHHLSNRIAIGVLAGTTVLIVVNPLLYYSVALDFHIEAISTLFAILTAFDIWSGRDRRALAWLVVCLLCGAIGGLYLAGVGISATLASPSTRRMGTVALVSGVVWVGLITALGDNLGSEFSTGYGYLTGHPTVAAGFGGVAAVGFGAVTHPGRWIGVLGHRLHVIATYLVPGGVVGAATAWGIGVPAVVLLSSALQSTPLFINTPYQQFAVFPFVLFGTVVLLTWFTSDRVPAWAPGALWTTHRVGRQVVASAVAGLALLGATAYAVQRLPATLKVLPLGALVPRSEASVLRHVLDRTPSDAEVIASLPVSGRFSSRRYLYLFLTPGSSIPVHTGAVFLVMDTSHSGSVVSPSQEIEAGNYAVRDLHAHTIVRDANVWALSWSSHPPDASVVLP